MFGLTIGPEFVLAFVSTLRICWSLVEFDKNRVKYWLALLECSLSKDAMTKHRFALQASGAATRHYQAEILVLACLMAAGMYFKIEMVAWIGTAVVIGYCVFHWVVIGRSFRRSTAVAKMREFMIAKIHPADRAIRLANEFRDW